MQSIRSGLGYCSAVAAVFLTASAPAFARELVHLATGFDLEVVSHVSGPASVTLTTSTGTVELPAEAITGIDNLPDTLQIQPGLKPNRPPDALSALIDDAAASQSNSPEFLRLVRSVAQVESALKQSAVSRKGAIGIMQLMPATAKELGVVATNAQDNVRGGARYLRELLLRYHSDSVLALAAYNAGPGSVAKYRGVPPFYETRRYISHVLQAYAKSQITVR